MQVASYSSKTTIPATARWSECDTLEAVRNKLEAWKLATESYLCQSQWVWFWKNWEYSSQWPAEIDPIDFLVASGKPTPYAKMTHWNVWKPFVATFTTIYLSDYGQFLTIGAASICFSL